MNGIRDPQKGLPLTEATFFILLCLSPKPKHGYAIMKEVEALSEGRVILSTGTLYGALKRLLEKGWIKRVDQSESDKTSRGRKSYALTNYGHRVLNADFDRLKKIVNTAREFAMEEPQ
jgi:DNA-binding PadR family transcriptional regulator